MVSTWIDVSPIDRFMSHVEVTNNCWLWKGTTIYGYGYFSIEGTSRRAHRYLYQYLFGPLKQELTLDHLCRVRNCVNPNHLEPVSNWENCLRGNNIAALNSKKTHCKRGHPLIGENLKIIPNGRQCITCLNYRAWARNNDNRNIEEYWKEAKISHLTNQALEIVKMKKAGIHKDE